MASFNSFDQFVMWIKMVKETPPPPYLRPQIYHPMINNGFVVRPRAVLPNGFNVKYNYEPRSREETAKVWSSAPGGAYFLRHKPPRPTASEDNNNNRITVYNAPGYGRGGHPFSAIREVSQWQREQWQVSKEEEEEEDHSSEFRSDGTDYDDEGYNSIGYDMFGGKKPGHNERGYDRRGYDRKGYNYFGFNKHGYSCHDYGKDGFNENGYDCEGYDRRGYNDVGLTRTDYDAEGYDAYGFDSYGYDRDGYNGYGGKLEDYDDNGLDKFGCNCYGYFKGELEFPGASEEGEEEEEEEEETGCDRGDYKHEISPIAPASLASERAVLAAAREMASLAIAKAAAHIRRQQRYRT